jgi:hypothetical protein
MKENLIMKLFHQLQALVLSSFIPELQNKALRDLECQMTRKDPHDGRKIVVIKTNLIIPQCYSCLHIAKSLQMLSHNHGHQELLH